MTGVGNGGNGTSVAILCTSIGDTMFMGPWQLDRRANQWKRPLVKLDDIEPRRYRMGPKVRRRS